MAACEHESDAGDGRRWRWKAKLTGPKIWKLRRYDFTIQLLLEADAADRAAGTAGGRGRRSGRHGVGGRGGGTDGLVGCRANWNSQRTGRTAERDSLQ